MLVLSKSVESPPRSPPTAGATLGDLIFNNQNNKNSIGGNNNNPRPSNSVKIYTPGMIPSAPDPRSPSLKFDSGSPPLQRPMHRGAMPTPVAPHHGGPAHHAHRNMGSATPMPPQGMMPVTPSVPRMAAHQPRTPPPRSNLVPPAQRANTNVRSSPPPPPRMTIGPNGPAMNGGRPGLPPVKVTSPRPTPVSSRRHDDGTKAPSPPPVGLMSQFLEAPPMKPKFGTQINWNPAHFVPSVPSPLNRAQQQGRESCQCFGVGQLHLELFGNFRNLPPEYLFHPIVSFCISISEVVLFYVMSK